MKPLGGLVAGILQASAAEDLYLIKCTINSMQIEFDPAKRHETLLHRGLDFADCQQAFAGVSFTFEDARKGYGEHRFITWALMQERLVVIVWTPRGEVRRIISLRKANEREIEKFSQALDSPG